jgi:hypothetical protein
MTQTISIAPFEVWTGHDPIRNRKFPRPATVPDRLVFVVGEGAAGQAGLTNRTNF